MEAASPLNHACDLLLGAFLQTKTEVTEKSIPTTGTLMLELSADYRSAEHELQLEAAQAACRDALVLHWPLTFPQIFAKGGFDCVLGNPPWERIKLQEEEFFSSRNADIATAKNKAERTQRIELLEQGLLTATLYPDLPHSLIQANAERNLYRTFIIARRVAEAASVYFHVNGDEGGRYPLTGVGDVNTYALFSESILQTTAKTGRAGFIVPTGIATDDSTKAFFGHISQTERLASLYDIENREKLFPAVDSRMKFCLITLGKTQQAEFTFFATQVSQLTDPRRRFRLTPAEFRLINPNTLTCPVFRSERDAELTKKLYRAAPVLIDENREDGNPWGISFMRMLDMSNDSHLFQGSPEENSLPLYEAKMIHQFDHRWATYQEENTRDTTQQEKADPVYAVTPRYWISSADVEERLIRRDRDGNIIWQWKHQWLMGWRDICRATDERTVIASVIPKSGVGNKMPLILSSKSNSGEQMAALIANISMLVFDFVARQKIGGTTLNYFYLKQFPVLSPEQYTQSQIDFIKLRMLELTYTTYDLKPWAEDLGFDGEPFLFDPDRRAIIRAELDAYYAKLYGLTRDELRYILDPADVMGADYPSETFRVLKNNEMKEFGEYRTQRLVLREFDRMTLAEANGEEYTSLLVPPPGQKADPTYASVGVFRDHEDAQLAGLIWAAIATGNASQAEIRGLLTLLSLPQALDIYLSTESLATAKQLFNKYQALFTQERINHADTIISHFKRQTWVRTDSKSILSVSMHSEPDGIQVNDELTTLAEHLLVAAKVSLQSDKQQAGANTETSTKSA